MNAFSRSWLITKLAFGVINKDRELLGFALLSFIFSTVFAIAMIIPSILPTLIENDYSYESLQLVEYLVIFATYFGLAFIATFFNVCVVYTTKVRFEGGNATFGESFKFAISRLSLIFQWSLIAATVGLLLRILDNLASRLGKGGQILAQIVIGLIGMAWSVVTIFVVPVLVYENVGPMDAIKKSALVIKKTWGESLIRSIGLGIIQFVSMLLVIGVSLGIIYGLSSVMGETGLLVGIAIGAMLLLLTGLIFSVANTIFNTALYVYANNNQLASGFNEDVMKDAFRPK